MKRGPATLLVLLLALAIVAPWLAPYNPESLHRDFLFAPPMLPRVIDDSGVHAPFVYPIRLADRINQQYAEDRTRHQPLPWFSSDETTTPAFLLGADSYGRDVLSRLLHGARLSISLALLSTLGAVLLGSVVGGIAGFWRGWIDDTAMRIADFVLVLPVIYVVLVLRAMMPLVMPTSTVFLSMAAIFALVGWPFVARGVRAIVAGERDKEYVIAAQSLGAGASRIIAHHLLPACVGHLVVQATLLMPAFILAEATLSYVGLGFPEHVPTWGTMLIEAANLNALTRFPWTLTPAIAIFSVVFAVNVLLRNTDTAVTRAHSR